MMNSLWSFGLAILALCPSVSVARTELDISNEVSRAVKAAKVDPKGLAILITTANGTVVLERNADSKMIPASLTKIVTAAALLEKFPVGHQFQTEILAVGEVKGGILHGDLYLRGGGDAGFVSESMWVLVNDFLRSGITSVEGNIKVDDSCFDSVRFDDSREQKRVDRAYDAPIGGMTFNWSAVNVFVRPSTNGNGKPQVFLDPENDYIKLENVASTSKNGPTSLTVESRGLSNGKEIVRVSGKISSKEKEKVFYKSVIQPEIWAGENLRAFLKRRGVMVKGKVVAGKVPKGARLLTTFKGRTIADLVSSMMKYSNNYIAEILVKSLGADKASKPGTLSSGMAVVRKYLIEKGVSEEHFAITNPSGLSRSNKLRARDLVLVLRSLRKNFRVFPEYLFGFPISGVDGTLKSRLNGELSGNIRAKTGHLSGVAGLAGYLGGESGEVYPFAFIFNGNDKQAWSAKELFEQILKILMAADKKLQ